MTKDFLMKYYAVQMLKKYEYDILRQQTQINIRNYNICHTVFY